MTTHPQAEQDDPRMLVDVVTGEAAPQMLPLYALGANYRFLADLMAEEDVDLQTALDDIAEDFTTKSASILRIARVLELEEEAFRAEAARILNLADLRKRRFDWLLDYLKRNMVAAGLTRVESGAFGARLQTNSTPTVEVLEPTRLYGPRFWRFVPARWETDKRAIAAAWKAGEHIKGVVVAVGTHLRRL